MLSLRIEDSFKGLTVIEWEPLLADNPRVEALWGNSKQEVDVLRRYPDNDFDLVVPDLMAMERAATLLGLPLVVEAALVNRGLYQLNKPDGVWREFAAQTGPNLSRGLVTRATARALRSGKAGNKDLNSLRKVLVESYLDNVSPVEADVLFGLRCRGARL